MTLEEKTIFNLKKLLNEHIKSKVGLDFFYDSIALLNQDCLFQNCLQTKIVEKEQGLSFSTKTLEIQINPQSNEKMIEKEIKELVQYQTLERKIQVFNMYFIFALLHEVKHINQVEVALNSHLEQNFTQQAHRIWYDFMLSPMSNYKQRIYELYNKYHNFLFFEREANIFSLQIVLQLFDVPLLKSYCQRNLLSHFKIGYINKGPFIKSPIEYTCNLFGSSIDITAMPNCTFMEKMEMGLPLKESEMLQLINIFKLKYETNEEIIKSLKKIA